MQSRRVITITLIIGLSIAIAGCRKPNDDPQDQQVAYDPQNDPLVNPPGLLAPPPDDISRIDTEATLTLHLVAGPETLNPLFVMSEPDFTVVDEIFVPLFQFDRTLAWSVNADLVESFAESQDHTEFTVTIRAGLTWQDGHPFAAHDVVYSWQKILDPSVPCYAQKPSAEPIEQCIALDDLTVKYVQPNPLATRHWNLLFPIIPKHIFEKDSAAHPDLRTGPVYRQFSTNPVGNGPYRIVEWKENTKIVLERWDGFSGTRPYFKTLIFRIIPDRNMALLSFEKGEIDVIKGLTTQQFALQTDAFAKTGCKAWSTMWTYDYIGWNMDGGNHFFTDKRVRYAMTHAMNIPYLLDKVYYNLATQCGGLYHPQAWMFNSSITLLDYNLEKAKACLDDAGWIVNPDDGWRYKVINGEQVPFEFTLVVPSGRSGSSKVAGIYQESLKKIGVRMNTQIMENTLLVEKLRRHEYQAVLGSWATGVDPDQAWNVWRSEAYETGRNYGGYSNNRIDTLFELGRKEFNFDKRRDIYREIQKIIYDDQPYTWICNVPVLSAFNKRIHGVQFSPRGIANFKPGIDRWWAAKTP